MITFKRKIYDQLLEWKEKYAGRYAMLIEGPRRVGKTTLVRQFAQNEYETSIIIDFGQTSNEIISAFKDHRSNLNDFFLYLQEATGVKLLERRSVIVFDEVQKYPPAREMIKYLVEDGRYDYIETGSLLSIKQNVKDIIIPSEEDSLYMHPMDFEEFLWARGNTTSIPFIREAFEKRQPLGFDLHKKYMRLYTEYMLIGGMPQAVASFLEHNNFDDVEHTKAGILKLYDNDLPKINVDGGSKSKRIFNNVPSFLSKHEKTFSPGQLRKGSKTREYFDSILWLKEAGIVNVCQRSSDPSPMLDLSIYETSIKLYMADTGLLTTAALRSNSGIDRDIYGAMIKGKMNVNNGMLFENMVAQELVAKGYNLFFSRFYVKETDYPQEIDFLLAKTNEIVPIEVKSGVSAKHRSLDRFMEKYSDRTKHGIVIHSKDLRVDGDILYIPIYMCMFL